jgi:UDP-N-acetylmuramate-alanine ligase
MLFVSEVYGAGESGSYAESHESLLKALPAAHFMPLVKSSKLLEEHLKPGDLLLTMGAGDITNFGRSLFETENTSS